MTKPRPQVTCPHYGTSGIAPSMKRWHFDKCRQNPQTAQQQETINRKAGEKVARCKSARLLAQAADDDFLKEVFAIVGKHDVSHTEAVLMWCEKRGIDVEHAGGIINKRGRENVVLRLAIQGRWSW